MRFVRCMDCGASTSYRAQEDAISSWNARPGEGRRREVAEKLHAFGVAPRPNVVGAKGGVRRCRRCGMAGHFAKTCRWRKNWVPVEAMRWRCFCLAWGQIGLAVVIDARRGHSER